MLKWLNYEQTASFDNKRHSNVVLACMFQPLKQIRAKCRFLFVCLFSWFYKTWKDYARNHTLLRFACSENQKQCSLTQSLDNKHQKVTQIQPEPVLF